MSAEWLNSTTALIAALGTLLGGVAALWPQLMAIMRVPADAGRAVRYKGLLLIGSLLLAFSGIVFAVRWFRERNVPLNEKLATQAWDALHGGDYRTALSKADDCILFFDAQGDHEKADASNDLAPCFFIKGEAAGKLGRKDDAIAPYTKTMRYNYARIYDPNGRFFWSPAVVASDRLAAIRPSVEITYPRDKQQVDRMLDVHGKGQGMLTDQEIWVFVKSANSDYYLYPTSSSDPSGEDWQARVCVGQVEGGDTEFTIFACPVESQAQGIFLEDHRLLCEKQIPQLPSTVRLTNCSKKTVYLEPYKAHPQYKR